MPRRRRADEAFGSAASAIGPITPDMSLFLVTRGQFSMIDMILHAIQQMGPSEISVWTWAIADYEVAAMAGLMGRGEITGGRLIVDQSADQRNSATIESWRQRFGGQSVRICKNHAKIARISNGSLKVLIRGSCNLNFNPRFENVDISEGGPEYDLVRRIEDEMPILDREYSHAEAQAASGLGRAFESKTLALFGTAKVWAK